MEIFLNLTEDFNPLRSTSANTLKHEKFIFNGGEPHIKLKLDEQHKTADKVEVVITQKIKSFVDLGFLCLAVDALRRSMDITSINLFLPYYPGARQDRVMVEGEPLTSKVYAEIINSLKLAEVVIIDSHSDVSPALLDNCCNMSNSMFISSVVGKIPSNLAVVSPDAGANKKVQSLAKEIGFDQIIKCDKTRNTATGEITSFDVYANDIGGKDCIIVDDICDGGGTFIGLANALKEKGAGKLYLAITHGIFSKGFDVFKDHFERVYTTDSFISNLEDNSDILTVVPLKDFFTNG